MKYYFYVAKAEETLIPKEKYDILTAAGVINWVDKDRFLANASQVMNSNGLIVIYDFWITDKMNEKTEYTDWYQNQYLQKFPKPPRNEKVWNQNDLTEDFLMEKQTIYEMEYVFNLEDFIDFMMIQSNVNVKIESDEISEKETKKWMQDTLQAIFQNKTKTLIFSGYNWYIRKK